jgi:hypothetical protein
MAHGYTISLHKTHWNAILATDAMLQRFHNNQEAEMSGSECRSPISTVRIFKHVPRWGKCINVLGDYSQTGEYETRSTLRVSSLARIFQNTVKAAISGKTILQRNT